MFVCAGYQAIVALGGCNWGQLAKEALDQDINPLTSVHYTDLKPTGQFRHSAVGSNQMGCSLTWHKYISLGTNTGAIEQFPALNQSWRSCNHPTLSWPYRSHQVPCPVPRTTDCFSPLWPNTDHCPYAPAVCSVTGISWRIILSWLIEYSIYDNSRYLHSGIPSRSGILLSDMNGQTFYTMPHLNHPRSDAVF